MGEMKSIRNIMSHILLMVIGFSAIATFVFSLFSASFVTAAVHEHNSLATNAQANLDADYVSIVFVMGDVTLIQSFATVSPPAKGTQVYIGDMISTGKDGFVSLAFESGESVGIQPNSRIVIEEVDCQSIKEKCAITLRSENGQIHSDAYQNRSNGQLTDFTIETPFSAAAVRGGHRINLKEK